MVEHERFISRRRARFDGIDGKVNIPYGTALTCQDGFLIYPCFHIAYTSLSCGAIAATPIQISQCLPSELRFHSPPSVSNAAIMP